MHLIISLLIISALSTFQIHAIRPKSNFRGYASSHTHESNKTNKFEIPNALRNVTQRYIEQNNLKQDNKLSISIQNNLTLIKNEEQQEAVAIFEVPQEGSLHSFTQEEINRLKELFEVYECNNQGKYTILKFRYKNKNILPQNREQASILLYTPNYMEEDHEEKEIRRPRSEMYERLNEQQREALQNNQNNYRDFENIQASLSESVSTRKQEGLIGSTLVTTDKGQIAQRIGVSQEEYVVFNETSPGKYHGHVRSWSELTQEQQRALIKAEKVKPSGKII